MISNAKWIGMPTKTSGSWFRERYFIDFFDKITQIDRHEENITLKQVRRK